MRSRGRSRSPARSCSWFRDNLGLIGSAPEIETLARTVDDNGGCYFVPAFSGLFAPHWRTDARGVIAGLTGYITKGHLARAVLEATAWQTREVVEAMIADSGIGLATLRVDGGMTANNLLMQFLADVLDVPVVRPIVAETVSLGAAYAAGLAVGFWSGRDELRANWHMAAQWTPEHSPADRARLPQVAQGGGAHDRLARRGRRVVPVAVGDRVPRWRRCSRWCRWASSPCRESRRRYGFSDGPPPVEASKNDWTRSISTLVSPPGWIGSPNETVIR